MVFPIRIQLNQVDQHVFPQHCRIRVAVDFLRRIDPEHNLRI